MKNKLRLISGILLLAILCCGLLPACASPEAGAQQESNAPVHFVNGIDIFHSHDKDMMTIDGTHPTDLGFYCMAQALYKVLEQYFP